MQTDIDSFYASIDDFMNFIGDDEPLKNEFSWYYIHPSIASSSRRIPRSLGSRGSSTSIYTRSQEKCQGEEKKTAKQKIAEYHIEIQRLVVLFEHQMKIYLPKSKKITDAIRVRWCEDFRLCIEQDERSFEEILSILAFLPNCWYAKNVESAKKIREKFGFLWSEMEKTKNKSKYKKNNDLDNDLGKIPLGGTL
jgi:hypothetical protein